MVVSLGPMAPRSPQGDDKSEMYKSSVMNAMKETLGGGRKTRAIRVVTEGVTEGMSEVVTLILSPKEAGRRNPFIRRGHGQ